MQLNQTHFSFFLEQPQTFIVTGGERFTTVALFRLDGADLCTANLPPLPGVIFAPVLIKNREGIPLICGGGRFRNSPLPSDVSQRCYQFDYDTNNWVVLSVMMFNSHTGAAAARYPGGDYAIMGHTSATGGTRGD